MELLDEMLDRKVEREKLSQADGGATAAPAAATTPAPSTTTTATAATTTPTLTSTSKSGGTRLCWLCNRNSSLRFRLQGVIFLCFNCFRISYLSLLLPIIDTPTRRKSDTAFLKLIYNIEGERSASTASLGDESLASTYGEIIEPQHASFVMNSSMIRQRREEEEQRRISASGQKAETGGGAMTNVKSMWSCPRCTFLNPAMARACEACDFVNPGTVRCPVCNELCPIGSSTAASSKGSTSRCVHGEPHQTWNCRECGALNTLDGDRCYFCSQPRYWACSNCTALHHIARDESGLRYCPTCGAYNTFEDVLNGQAKIEKEEKHAELVTAHREVKEGGGSPATTADGHEIVFGVNDSQTLGERARQKEIESNEKRLQHRLNRLHISRNVQKTDGNCLFSALANQLFGQPRLHYLVRSLATAYMSYHAEDYAILFDGETEWRAYLSAMKEQGTWGDELCLNAAARCFHVNIHVITSDRDRWHIVFQYEQLGQSQMKTKTRSESRVVISEAPEMASPKKATAQQSPPVYEGVSVFLAYLAPVHYDDITPSPVKPLMLGELLSGELNKRVKTKQRDNQSCTTTPNATPPPSEPTAKGHGEPSGSVRPPPASRTSGPMPVKVRTAPSDNLVKLYLESSTDSSNTTAPAVPRTRPQSSSVKDAHHQQQEPPRPPPTPPANFRTHGDYTY
jgi:hypothetical protein